MELSSVSIENVVSVVSLDNSEDGNGLLIAGGVESPPEGTYSSTPILQYTVLSSPSISVEIPVVDETSLPLIDTELPCFKCGSE